MSEKDDLRSNREGLYAPVPHNETAYHLWKQFDPELATTLSKFFVGGLYQREVQHVLPKGFRRARNFGFLHPNCKRLVALLHVLLKFAPAQAMTWFKERAPILCTCCGAVMMIVKTRIRSVFSGVMPLPIATQGAH